jgi:NAD+ kinase
VIVKIARALLVHKKSVYQLYVTEHASEAVGQAIDRGDAQARRMLRSHEVQSAALDQVRRRLEALGVEVIVRYRAKARSTNGYDLVVSLGGDGTLLDTARRVLDQTPVLGLNSDPSSSVGALCAGHAGQIDALIGALRDGGLKPRPITRLRVRVDADDTFAPVLNDALYAHACPADLTRFEVGVLDAEAACALSPADSDVRLESVRGSGLWVATAAGSTAAVRSAGGRVMPRGSRKLQYVLREPYVPPSQPRPRGPQGGLVEPHQALVIINRTRRGMVWVDGPHRRRSVNYGQRVLIDRHPLSLHLVPPL